MFLEISIKKKENILRHHICTAGARGLMHFQWQGYQSVEMRMITKKIPDEQIIIDIKSVANVLGKSSVSTKEYKEHGQYEVKTILTRFKFWNSALKKAGLESTSYKVITDEDWFEEIERLWEIKGAQPTTTDLKNGNHYR